VPECLLIEPTESEAKEVLDRFIEALVQIQQESEQDAEFVKGAPYTMPVKRLDEVRAAKQLDVSWVTYNKT
jgi:glycine dehydrogenase subunit 2